jgi:hypothetical protein
MILMIVQVALSLLQEAAVYTCWVGPGLGVP